MIVQATFDYCSKHFDFCRPVLKLDRNFDDEDYAYFLEEIPNLYWALFEINIIKDADNHLLKNDGYVSVYLNADDTSPDEIVSASIRFWYH